MGCLSADQIAGYVAGESSTTDVESVQHHVDSCESCRQSIAAAVRAGRTTTGPTVGRYIVIDELGAGGMGVVYRAFDPELGRQVAVKRLRPEQVGDVAGARARLAREARALAALSHPNVVTVHDIGSEGDDIFIAMELVPGSTLRQWLAAEARSADAIVDVFRQAGRGLAAAHATGLVHRDFKPENVLVRADGRVQVGDFGLARAAGETDVTSEGVGESAGALVTRSGAVVGTLAYMAPEQARSEPADARSDQFSFAVALYEALAARRPFAASTFSALRERYARGEPAEPLPSSVPSWLRGVVARGLALDRRERYPSMDAFVDALGRDPRRARRRIAIGAGLVLGASAITAVVAVGATADHAGVVCESARPRLSRVWDQRRKLEAKAAFLGTKRPFALDTWVATEKLLDGYTERWIAAEAEACKDDRASPTLRDLRSACLDQRLASVAALADVLVKADAAVAENAPRAVQQLPEVETCADKAALTATVPPPNPAIAIQVAGVRRVLAQTSSLRAAGKMDDAAALIAPAIDVATRLGYAPLLAEALLVRGQVEAEVGRGEIAEKTLARAADTAELGRADAVKAEAWAQLVKVATQRAAYAAAHDHAEHARAVLGRLGPGHDATEARVLNFEGGAYMLEGNYAKALELQQRALAVRERLFGAESSEVATVLNSIGNVLYNLSRHAEAKVAHERALAIRRRVLGPMHPDVAASDNNLSSVLRSMGDADGAYKRLEEARAICDAVFGPRSSRSGQILGNMAGLLRDSGRYADSVKVGREALAIQEEALGADHPFVAGVHYIIGNSYLELHDVPHAKQELERALAIRLKKLGPEHPETLVNQSALGRLALDQGNAREARTIFETVLATQTKSLGPDHADLSATYTFLALALRALGDHRGALANCEHAFAIDKRVLGDEHGDVIIDYNCIGAEKLALRDYQGAVASLETGVALANKLTDVEGGIRGDAFFLLAQALWDSRGDRARAIDLAKRARDAFTAMGAAKAADLALANRWLAGHRTR